MTQPLQGEWHSRARGREEEVVALCKTWGSKGPHVLCSGMFDYLDKLVHVEEVVDVGASQIGHRFRRH
jgi:hypothetical protein